MEMKKVMLLIAVMLFSLEVGIGHAWIGDLNKRINITVQPNSIVKIEPGNWTNYNYTDYLPAMINDTPLNSWIYSSNSTNVTLYINTSGVTGSTIYLYYNGTTTANRSCDKTFAFCDDFNAASFNGTKWTASTNSSGYSRAYSGGLYTMTSTGTADPNGNNAMYHQLSEATTNYTILFKLRLNNPTTQYIQDGILISNTSNPATNGGFFVYPVFWNGASPNSILRVENYGVAELYIEGTTANSNWNNYSVVRNGDNFTVYREGVLKTSKILSIASTPYLAIREMTGKAGHTSDMDYIVVSNPINTTYTLGSNETLAGATGTITIATPLNQSYNSTFGNTTFNLTYNVIGTLANHNCSYYLDGVLKGSQITNNNTNYSFIINLSSPGQHNSNVTCNITGGTNSSQVSFYSYFTPNLTLSSSSGWNIGAGTSTLLSCSMNNGTPGLFRDGVLLPSNYTFSPGVGVYNISCQLNSSDSLLYAPNSTWSYLVVNAGQYGCYNTSTYAFQKNFTGVTSWPLNLNFTAIGLANLVRGDLGDVNVYSPQGTFNITLNITPTAYYMVLSNNSNISNFTVSFGNYPLSTSYVNGSLAANYQNMTGYSETGNSYYTVGLYDERANNVTLLPPSANISLTVYCSNGTSSFRIYNASTLLTSYSNVSQIRAYAYYSSSDLYYRDRLVTSPVADVQIFMVDSALYKTVQTVFKIDDNTGNFHLEDSTVIRVKKLLNGGLKVVTELPIDVERKAITYLLNGDSYQLYVDNLLESRSMGDIYADSSALTKTVTIMPTIAQNMTNFNSSYSLTMTAGVINFVWSDSGNNTNQAEMWVYNQSGSQLTYFNSTNRSYVNFVYDTGNPNGTYTAAWHIKHNVYGNSSIGGSLILVGLSLIPVINPFMLLITALGGGIIWFEMIFVIPIAMYLPRRYLGVGMMLFVGVISLLNYWAFTTIKWEVIGIAILIAILIEADELRKGR
jgi:hypothetical protein